MRRGENTSSPRRASAYKRHFARYNNFPAPVPHSVNRYNSMTHWERSAFSAVIALGAIVPSAEAADDGIEFFEKKIRPVLVQHCYECHSKDAKKQRGGLLLDSRAAIRKGGDTGPAVVPKKPGESVLIKAVRHTDAELKMPPKGKLPDAIIADLE